ncbi:response regulator transcription factor [Curtobacterium sp. Csp2]|nr:response regulator transcription factor [Curtobacterium sp. Csp2]
MTPVTTVVIVDDETLVRYGFELILGAAADIEVLATSGDVDAVETVRRHRPDVVLLDVRMPRVNGLQVLAQLRELPEPPAVAMLTTFDTDTQVVAEAMDAGAAGFLLKDTDPESLAEYVRALARGGIVLAPGVDRTRLFALRRSAVPPELSDREHAVVRSTPGASTMPPRASARTYSASDSGSVSLRRKPAAPASIASATTCVSVSNVVSIATAGGSGSSRSWARTCSPLTRGIRTSSRTTSGRCRRTVSTASTSPLVASTSMSAAAPRMSSKP